MIFLLMNGCEKYWKFQKPANEKEEFAEDEKLFIDLDMRNKQMIGQMIGQIFIKKSGKHSLHPSFLLNLKVFSVLL
jgi:hypothetical protein